MGTIDPSAYLESRDNPLNAAGPLVAGSSRRATLARGEVAGDELSGVSVRIIAEQACSEAIL